MEPPPTNNTFLYYPKDETSITKSFPDKLAILKLAYDFDFIIEEEIYRNVNQEKWNKLLTRYPPEEIIKSEKIKYDEFFRPSNSGDGNQSVNRLRCYDRNNFSHNAKIVLQTNYGSIMAHHQNLTKSPCIVSSATLNLFHCDIHVPRKSDGEHEKFREFLKTVKYTETKI